LRGEKASPHFRKLYRMERSEKTGEKTARNGSKRGEGLSTGLEGNWAKNLWMGKKELKTMNERIDYLE